MRWTTAWIQLAMGSSSCSWTMRWAACQSPANASRTASASRALEAAPVMSRRARSSTSVRHAVRGSARESRAGTTSAPTAFAVIGPRDANRDHPTNRLFVIPEPGRQSQFEDESILPQASWSPLDSPRYAVHFARHIARNVGTISARIGELDVLHLGLPAALVGLVLLLRRREPSERWYWSGVFIVGAWALTRNLRTHAPRAG